MTAWGWRLVELAARGLGEPEREAVLGDLAESGERARRALAAVLGLVARREVRLWKGWRPWLAAFGLALPSSFLLMGLSISVSWAFPRVLQAAARLGPRPDLVALTARALIPPLVMMAGGAFSAGFVVGSLSRRTLWVSVLACFLPCLYCMERFRTDSLSRFCLMLFVLPAIWGVREGMRGRRIDFRIAVLIAGGMTATVAIVWTYSPGWMIPLLWPAWYMAVMSRRIVQPT